MIFHPASLRSFCYSGKRRTWRVCLSFLFYPCCVLDACFFTVIHLVTPLNNRGRSVIAMPKWQVLRERKTITTGSSRLVHVKCCLVTVLLAAHGFSKLRSGQNNGRKPELTLECWAKVMHAFVCYDHTVNIETSWTHDDRFLEVESWIVTCSFTRWHLATCDDHMTTWKTDMAMKGMTLRNDLESYSNWTFGFLLLGQMAL